MKHLVYVFNDLNSAIRARDYLHDETGCTAVELTNLADDTGALDGNFLVEYKDATHDDDDSLFDRSFSRDDINEGLGRRPIMHNDKTLLVAVIADMAKLHVAEAILRQAGGTRPM